MKLESQADMISSDVTLSLWSPLKKKGSSNLLIPLESDFPLSSFHLEEGKWIIGRPRDTNVLLFIILLLSSQMSSHFSTKDKRGRKAFSGFDGYNKNTRIKFNVYFYPGRLFKI